MKISDYIKMAKQTDRLPQKNSAEEINPRLGLAGEIGSLLTELKKEVREDRPTAESTKQAVKDELGDIIWYAVTVANRASLDFQIDVLYGNLQRLKRSEPRLNLLPYFRRSALKPGGKVSEALESSGQASVSTFSKYQELAVLTSQWRRNKSALVPFLVQIWKNAGELLSSQLLATQGDTENKKMVAKALGDILWYVAGFADLYGLALDEVVSENATKIKSAFPSKSQRMSTPLYDDSFGPLERFPRKFNVDFVQQNDDVAVMLINGVRVGDPLRDNAYKTEKLHSSIVDGYRFHDSIHLAFVAVLGWSPVMRDLLMRKRKSDKDIDDAEDGARARIVEEMVAKIAHSHAIGIDKKKLLDEVSHINLNLLKDIVNLAEGLEVAGSRAGFAACKYWEWEKAILDGFKIYNLLRRNKGGRIKVDLLKRSVRFMPLKKDQGTHLPLSKA